MEEYFQANRKLWDAWTAINASSEFYDVAGFKQGKCTLLDIDLEEVGDVQRKKLLHLQCHFGLDTLSWARLGADVTGVDFSRDAITLARSLARELSIPAQFVPCNIYDLPKLLSGEYDIVFTFAGVLCWLPDLKRWAEIIAQFLEPGGLFYIREFHPFEYLHEFPFILYKSRPFLVQGGDGFWRYPALEGGLPLMFSIKAIKTKR